MRTPMIAAMVALPVLSFGFQAQAGGWWDRDCDRRYYAPAYSYYAPAYTYYQPRVVVAAPPVVYYSPRVYAAPRYYVDAGWRGWRGWRGGWDRWDRRW
jgi:hypothetical protein